MEAERVETRRSEWDARINEIKYSLYLIKKSPLLIVGISLTTFFIVLAFLAPILVDPKLALPEGYQGNTYPFYRKYVWNENHFIKWGEGVAYYKGPEFFPLGTDGWGRDLLAMIILSIPLDMYYAAIITVIAASFGTILGAIAGYFGGYIDEILMRITDIFLAFPGLVLALVLAALLGRTLETLVIAITVVWWPPYVRLMRGQVLSEKNKPYVEALMALGASKWRILFRHIIPNSIFPVIVQATMDYGGILLTFSALMFLGFSPSPSIPELGNLIADGYLHIFDAPWVLIFPGLTLMLISLGFNLIGDGIRDLFDPRLRR